jgi:hypothetical protein
MPETKLAPPASQSLGAALPPTVQHSMETHFGRSFAEVRVHVGPQATLVHASAFTKGNDIHFAPGQYQPFTDQGRLLLSHELTHVIQQNAVGRPSTPNGMIEVEPPPAK